MRFTQWLQLTIQKRIISRVLASQQRPKPPLLFKLFGIFPVLRAFRRACSASASAPSTCARRRLARRDMSARAVRRSAALLQLGRGAGEDFDQARFGVGVVFEPLADGLAQMIERGLDERRQRAAIARARRVQRGASG